jgi:hypothetical protein
VYLPFAARDATNIGAAFAFALIRLLRPAANPRIRRVVTGAKFRNHLRGPDFPVYNALSFGIKEYLAC